MKIEKTVSFYDAFAENQIKTGTNERIYHLYQRLKKYGLNSQSTVLELGCGIGTLSNLVAKDLPKGYIEAVDISPASIEVARARIKKSQVSFHVGDVVHYQPQRTVYDFITLFDVIEHVPLEHHTALFSNISRHMPAGSKLLINIPNPDYIRYDQQFQPELLQLIDQPVELESIARNLSNSGLDIVSFEKHSIWVKHDYAFYVVEKKKEFEEIPLSDSRSFYEKVHNKVLRLKLQLFHQYKS